ncbi:MAG TPA: hypothetical protein DCY35_04610 [Prolixibacteraceae bacterium]|nr:hypothetical protein [Prolixibacteraceae bacterium]
MNTQNQECCPEFNPAKWDKKTFQWENKHFLKETIPTIFHIPMPATVGKRITKMMELADKAEANIPDKTDALVLFRDPSAFRSEILYSVTKPIGGATNTFVTGTYQARVFEGSYSSVSKHMHTMQNELRIHGKEAKDFMVHYAYCPGCAKKFGHNYMILFAEVYNH